MLRGGIVKNIYLKSKNLGIILLIWSVIFPVLVFFEWDNHFSSKFVVLIILSVFLELLFIGGGIFSIKIDSAIVLPVKKLSGNPEGQK